MKLGDKVMVRAVLERVSLTWERREVEPFEATVVGKRTLWDSRWDSEGWEYPETRYIDHFWSALPAVLVARDLRRILRVAPEDAEFA